MRCRHCSSRNTRVTCTEHEANTTKRYCRCLDCGQRYRTREYYEKPKPGPAPGGKLPSTQGSRNGFAVLTEQNVRDIRRRSEEGASNRAIAAVFGINASTVSRIVTRKVWSHVL
jgi:hypothetical protein